MRRHVRMRAFVALSAVLVGCHSPWVVGADDCPAPSFIGQQRVFIFKEDHSVAIAMRTALAVNSDGAPAAYTVGDHGITYIANGLDLWRAGKRVDCRPASAGCRKQFLDAEVGNFGTGTPEFCVFAMEIVTPTGVAPTPCSGGQVIGNGKGAPKPGKPLATVTGEEITPYESTTALRHNVNGVQVYVDATKVPSVVGVKSRRTDLGHVAWVRSRKFARESFAIVGDLGRDYGEGSVALHQLLRYGVLSDQMPGPIDPAHRCQQSELGLAHAQPYVSKPDRRRDECVKGKQPLALTDIRAYVGMATVDTIILGAAEFPHKDNVVGEELTAQSIEAKAVAAGYTSAKLEQMAQCLDR